MRKTLKFARYDAELNTDPCNAYNNANLTLKMRLGFNQINPKNGADKGKYKDASGKVRDIIKWTDDAWKAWKYHFLLSAKNYWSGNFWLHNNCGGFAFKQRGEIYLPNIYCLLDISTAYPKSSPHHNIDVVRVIPDKAFDSNVILMDSDDIQFSSPLKNSKGNKIFYKTHLHEVGHMLGLGHVDIGKAHCPSTNTNSRECYGITDESKYSIMGAGPLARDSNAAPWLKAMEKFDKDLYISKIYMPPKKRFSIPQKNWIIKRKRIYPATSAEYESFQIITKVQPRKL